MEPTSKRKRSSRNKPPPVQVDGAQWFAMPYAVMNSIAYMNLSHSARALLFEAALQYDNKNNGTLKLSRKGLRDRGWLSVDGITKAKKELLEAGFLFETCQGARPNKASLYAITWASLDRCAEYDAGVFQAFRRGDYNHAKPKPKRAAPTFPNSSKNASLVPPTGHIASSIGPHGGQGKPSAGPESGPIKAQTVTSPVPPHGHHLEKPSALSKQPAPAQKKPRGRQWSPDLLFPDDSTLPRLLATVACATCGAAPGRRHTESKCEPCPRCGAVGYLKCQCGGRVPTKAMRAGRSPAISIGETT